MPLVKPCTPSACALFRVFIQPSLTTRLPTAVYQSNTKPQQCSLQSLASSRRTIYAYAKPVRSKTASNPSELHTLDEAIRSHTIHVVDASNAIQRNLNLHNVLRDLDRETTHLRQITLEKSTGIPVCKTVTKKELWEEVKAKQKESKKKDVEDTSKQIELNWAIDPNDLGHRVKRLQEFLSEGRRVEVLIASKRRGRRASVEEMEELLEKIRGAVTEVPGAEEWKEMDGGPGAQTLLHFQGDREKQSVLKEAAHMDEVKGVAVDDKQARKEREKRERKEKEERRMQRKKEENDSKEQAKKLVM